MILDELTRKMLGSKDLWERLFFILHGVDIVCKIECVKIFICFLENSTIEYGKAFLIKNSKVFDVNCLR